MTITNWRRLLGGGAHHQFKIKRRWPPIEKMIRKKKSWSTIKEKIKNRPGDFLEGDNEEDQHGCTLVVVQKD